MTSIEIPGNITSIGNYAFQCCSSLVSIKIPEGVTSIGEHAFSSCDRLTSIEIPKNVTVIGERAFGWCNSLQEMYLKAPEPPVVEEDLYSMSHCTLYVPKGSRAAYRQAAFWNGFKEIIEE